MKDLVLRIDDIYVPTKRREEIDPATVEAIAEISGIGPARARRFAPEVLGIVARSVEPVSDGR